MSIKKWQLGKSFDLLKILSFFAWRIPATRMFHAPSTILSCFKFSLKRKRQRYRVPTKALERKILDRSANPVFQLDPLKGHYAPVVPNTVRQESWANLLQQALTEVLSSKDLDRKLQSLTIEITKVKVTRDLGNAIVSWQMPDPVDEDGVARVQELLERNRDMIRKLLPLYSPLSRSPQLHFTREKKAVYVSEVEALLETADYGDDYELQQAQVPEDFFKSPYSDR